MYPDKRLGQDIMLICSTTFVLLIVLLLAQADFGYAPKDECANTLRSALSPFQVSQLVDGVMPVSYGDVAEWCSDHLDEWPDRLNDARQYAETPSTYDMMF